MARKRETVPRSAKDEDMRHLMAHVSHQRKLAVVTTTPKSAVHCDVAVPVAPFRNTSVDATSPRFSRRSSTFGVGDQETVIVPLPIRTARPVARPNWG